VSHPPFPPPITSFSSLSVIPLPGLPIAVKQATRPARYSRSGPVLRSLSAIYPVGLTFRTPHGNSAVRRTGGTIYHGVVPPPARVISISTKLHGLNPTPGFLGRDNRQKARGIELIRIAKRAGMPLKSLSAVERVDKRYFKRWLRGPLRLNASLCRMGWRNQRSEKGAIFRGMPTLSFPIDLARNRIAALIIN